MEPSQRARIVDASLNRAAEGLRVAEDICRFGWDLPGMAGELRSVRHELLAAGRPGPAARAAQLEARDIEDDVGRADRPGTAPDRGPGAGEPLEATAARNLERAREALRTLEEVLRTEAPARAARFGACRYRVYSVEKGLEHLRAGGSARREALRRSRLCLLVTEALSRRPWLDAVEAALRGGADMVQLREKALSDRELIARSRRLRELTARHGALFVVNDRPDLARIAGADGVHLGQDDLPLAAARSVAGDEALIGVSTHSLEQALRAARQGADYVGAGPVFPTRTKDAGPRLELPELRRLIAEAGRPVFAIGGVREDRLDALLGVSADRVAVSSAVLGSEDPEATTRALRTRLEEAGASAAAEG